ncbi:MAG: ATP-binding protein, partial [Patescibacteria group bacterium]
FSLIHFNSSVLIHKGMSHSHIKSKVYDDILYRDIAVRHDIKEVKSLRELSLYLISNFSTLFSYNSLKKFLNLGSANTVKSYLEYLENSFIFFIVNLYSLSLKKQFVSPKKVYCIDNGLANVISFKFSKNKGKFLENMVFLDLIRKKKNIYYYKTKNNLEVDFLIKKGLKITEIIQVCWSLADGDTREREIKSLTVAMDDLRISKSLILTDNDEEIIKINKKTIIVKPVYKWLLEN